MCGICGKVYFDKNYNVENEVIENMVKSMIHRGPDGSGTYINGQVGLGHRRLSIIDLDTGKQPISNENNQIWITFNGEIYNYKELRAELVKKGHIFKTKTDTEVILHLYEDLGELCLEKLRGMFAFAIWDNRKSKLFLARDRVGIKPLYYTIIKNALLFASEIKALLQEPTIERSINPEGVYNFLSCTYTPGPESVFQNIFKLQPGHYLTLENEKIIVKQFWDISSYFTSDSRNLRDLEAHLLDLLKETTKIHMISDVPVGFLLSGGVDSTAILNFYQEELTSDIKTFTVGFESQEFEDERKYARIAAKRYGVDYHETTITADQFFNFLPKYIWYMEEPIFEPPAVSLYYVTKMASKHVKVLLSGEGGDEAFAGYQTYRNLVWLERIKKILGSKKNAFSNIAARTYDLFNFEFGKKYIPLVNMALKDYYFSRASSPTNLFNRAFNQLFSSEYLNLINQGEISRLFSNYNMRIHNGSPLKKMLYIDTKTWLPDRLLLKADKMTMANSLELRVPLLDHKVLEFAASLPDNQKLNGLTTKYIFKKILRNRIPKKIIKRKKAGFPIPYTNWLDKNISFVLDILMDKKSLERGYFNKQALQDLLLNKWMANGKYSMEIFNLLTLELWHRAFIDNESKFN